MPSLLDIPVEVLHSNKIEPITAWLNSLNHVQRYNKKSFLFKWARFWNLQLTGDQVTDAIGPE